jgi:AbrB family looped-hinge helix DNA binding protein
MARKSKKVQETVAAYTAGQAPRPETRQVSITAKGQIVIPAALRRKYGITPQTRIAISDDGERIVLKPITHELIDRLCGLLKGSGTMQEYLAEKAKEIEREDADPPRR